MISEEEEEFLLIDSLLDQCYQREWRVPQGISEYLWRRYKELKGSKGSITIQVPLNVCKCTSEDDHEFNRNKT